MSILDSIKRYCYIFFIFGIVTIAVVIYGVVKQISYLENTKETIGTVINVDRDFDYDKLFIQYENKFIDSGAIKTGRTSVATRNRRNFHSGDTVSIYYDKKGKITLNTFSGVFGPAMAAFISGIISLSIGIFGLVLRKTGKSNEEVMNAYYNISTSEVLRTISHVSSYVYKISTWLLYIIFICGAFYIMWIIF